METRIRTATREDMPTIAAVIRDSFARHAAPHIQEDSPLFSAAHLGERMDDPATRWAVLGESEGRTGAVVGVAMWRMLADTSHLHLLFVASARQGRGYGARLLTHHRAEALRENPALVLTTLHCQRASVWAMRFYAAQNYRLYADGDEARVAGLATWVAACRAREEGFPLPAHKVLFYKPLAASV